MSISLKVVSMAQVFCASFKRAAIFKRIRLILTFVSVRVPVMGGGPPPAGGAGAGFGAAAAGAGAGAGAGFGAAGAGAAGAGAGAGAAAAGAAAALAGAAPGFILKTSWPDLTVSPLFTRIAVTTPAKGACTGIVVLSVSISMTASSAANESPTLHVNLKPKGWQLKVRAVYCASYLLDVTF